MTTIFAYEAELFVPLSWIQVPKPERRLVAELQRAIKTESLWQFRVKLNKYFFYFYFFFTQQSKVTILESISLKVDVPIQIL